VNPGRALEVLAGLTFLLFAGLAGAYFFTVHERFYRYGVPVLGLLGMGFLFLVGLGYSLIFRWTAECGHE